MFRIFSRCCLFRIHTCLISFMISFVKAWMNLWWNPSCTQQDAAPRLNRFQMASDSVIYMHVCEHTLLWQHFLPNRLWLCRNDDCFHWFALVCNTHLLLCLWYLISPISFSLGQCFARSGTHVLWFGIHYTPFLTFCDQLTIIVS